jgi:ubiquitin-conjugating enzyme (huntingtin interacting protein 2)
MPPVRISREITKLKDDPEIKIRSFNADYSEIIAQIPGPSDSPYENGRFNLEIKITEEYPFEPPKIKFLTRIWHPNISSVTGYICLDILKKDKWSPALSLHSVLISIQSLLNEPIPEDPQDGVAGLQYIDNNEEFVKTAKEWVNLYAS